MTVLMSRYCDAMIVVMSRYCYAMIVLMSTVQFFCIISNKFHFINHSGWLGGRCMVFIIFSLSIFNSLLLLNFFKIFFQKISTQNFFIKFHAFATKCSENGWEFTRR